MQTVLRHSGRLCTRVSKRRLRQFTSAAVQHSSDWTPEDRDRAREHDHPVTRPAAARKSEATEEVIENAEGRRTGFRRTLRQRKPADIPKPPPLPAWFLKRNVVLNSKSRGVGDESSRHSVDCVDADTGKILFNIQCDEDAASKLVESSGKRQQASDKPPSPKARKDQNTANAALDGATSIFIQAEAFINGTFALAGHHVPTFTASKSDLSLYSHDPRGHAYMDSYVDNLAASVGADIVRVDANDIADLTEEYVGQGNDSPGTFSTLAHAAYAGLKSTTAVASSAIHHGLTRSPFEELREEEEEEEEDEEEDDEEDEDDDSRDRSHDSSQKFIPLHQMLKSQVGNLERGLNQVPMGFGFAIPAGIMSGKMGIGSSRRKCSSESNYVQWDDARLVAVLDQFIDAPELKRAAASIDDPLAPSMQQHEAPGSVANIVAELLTVNADVRNSAQGLQWRKAKTSSGQRASDTKPRTIIQIKDLRDICESKLGDAIVTRFAKTVQKRRRLGEQIILVGTSTSGDSHIEGDSPFVSLLVPSKDQAAAMAHVHIDPVTASTASIIADRGYSKIMEVNMRNIGSMLRRLQSDQSTDVLFSIPEDQLLWPGVSMLVRGTLHQEKVHRLVLTAIGLARSHAESAQVSAVHVALAAAILSTSDIAAVRDRVQGAANNVFGPFGPFGRPGGNLTGNIRVSDEKAGDSKIDQIKQGCNSHETRLLSGVVDAQNIKTRFDDVHVAPDTIEALKTLTSLSLLRPDAFKYGILAKDNLSGVMLYGPPGTGKTLLAKAVAKESKATVLEVSGAQVYEKYVGEGEKMVRAVFTLAKKLSPCVVFIDEADALFGTRNSASNRSTHRELINQFLREWDGMDDHKVFIMVATNRPFDVDDAVLRRLPRRLLVDLPVAKDRESILGIHLRDEAIDSVVSLSALAEQTPLYSGSDLKNLCVAAALAAVREENELAAKHSDDAEFSLPDKRTLHQRHFDKGLQEISASISEDMSSLNAIRKFDEQYGDRKGRRKKASYGFGALDAPIDENAARVRQGS